MDIPLFIFLIVYGVGLLIFFVWAVFHLYHMVKFGMFDFTGKLNTFIFVSVGIIILLLTALLLQGTPWQETINVLDVREVQNNIDLFDRL